MDNMGQLYVNKLLNLNEMDKILETHMLAKLTQEEMESLSRSLISKQTEAVIRTQQGFIIARTWKQPGCPSADEWIRKLWYIYSMYLFKLKFLSFPDIYAQK